MKYFPVSNSTLSSVHLGLFVQYKYNLNENSACTLIKTGINDTYLIDTHSEKFIFRVYSLKWRTQTEILEEIKLLTLLKENNLSISYAIPDKNNEFIQTLNAPEGDRFGVLFSYAKGQKLHSFSPSIHFKVGEMMAKQHLITNKLSLNRATYTSDILLKKSLPQISEFLSDQSEEMAFMKSAQKLLIKELENVNVTEIRNGVVHLDIWFDNLNIEQESNAVTIFDFDFCGNGWLCLDLAYYMMQVYYTERNEDECKQKLDSFFEGYESITKISAEEKRLLPILGVSLYFFYLGIQCQRYDNWSNTFLNEAYLKRYISQIVKRYFDIHHLEKL